MNIFDALIGKINDLARWIFGTRSTDDLLADTIDSMQNAFGQSYEATKSASGQILVSENMLAAAQSAAKTAHANVNHAVRDSQRMTGTDLQIQQQKIVRLQQIATHADEAATAMEATINRAKQLQLTTEGRVAVSAADMQMRQTAATTDAAMEKLYQTMEKVSDSQLRAAGYLNSPHAKDFSGEISRRAATARGRAEASQRMTDQIIGNPFATDLDENEQSILEAAYAAAGAKNPAKKDADQTASAS